MKKAFFIILFICCIFPLMAIDAEIISVHGKVEIKQGASWRPAKKGEKIPAGSMIATGFRSELSLKIDGSLIRVEQLTRLKIEQIAKKEEAVSSEVHLNMGSIKANVKPASTKKVEFKVKTPVATASVRGTSGIIDSDGTLIGTTGQWAYTNLKGETTAVNAGHIVKINSLGTITPAQNTIVAMTSTNEIKTLAETQTNSLSIATSNKISNYNIAKEGLEHQVAEININVAWE